MPWYVVTRKHSSGISGFSCDLAYFHYPSRLEHFPFSFNEDVIRQYVPLCPKHTDFVRREDMLRAQTMTRDIELLWGVVREADPDSLLCRSAAEVLSQKQIERTNLVVRPHDRY